MKISTTKQLGAYLKDVRLDNEFSQTDVAKKVGLRQGTVSSFELRAGSTKLETFFKLLSALELDCEITPRHSKNKDNKSNWPEEW